ncbi:hypothetical protein [Terasakiella pusilla]|uniref:hypothetical protein n=1 Tax=Terasakiella pusilla TaxID=64973 RepID=UPI003AA929CE
MDFSSDDILKILGGGVVASVMTNLFISRRETKKHNRMMKGLAASLHAEIKAKRNEVIHHKYREALQEFIDALKAGRTNEVPKYNTHNDPAKSVYYVNLTTIGHLPEPIPEKLTGLYSMADSITLDYQAMDAGKWDHRDNKDKAEFLEVVLQNYDWTVEKADDVLSELESYLGK